MTELKRSLSSLLGLGITAVLHDKPIEDSTHPILPRQVSQTRVSGTFTDYHNAQPVPCFRFALNFTLNSQFSRLVTFCLASTQANRHRGTVIPSTSASQVDSDLRNILSKIRTNAPLGTRGEEYPEFFKGHSKEWVWQRIQRESRVLDIIRSNTHPDKATLDSLSKDYIYLAQEPGCYLGHMTSELDLEYSKRYGGQANVTIRDRCCRHKKDKQAGTKNLFYNLWRAVDKKRHVRWLVLSIKEPSTGSTLDEQLWSNISEMFYCITFQTLPKILLQKYLDAA